MLLLNVKTVNQAIQQATLKSVSMNVELTPSSIPQNPQAVKHVLQMNTRIRMVLANYVLMLLLVATLADTIISMTMSTVMNAQLILDLLTEKRSIQRIMNVLLLTIAVFQSASEMLLLVKE